MVPVAEHADKVLVHVVRVLSKKLQLLHVHLFKQRVYVDTLFEAFDLGIYFGVALIELCVILQELFVLGIDPLKVLLSTLILGLKFR